MYNLSKVCSIIIMSSIEEETTDVQSPRIIGQVKWFNNKAGYGFITVNSGDHKGKDIFIHYSAIRVVNSQYKYLVQGEYVEFSLVHSTSTEHEFQAVDISGIGGGNLMCETRNNTVAQFSAGGGNGGEVRVGVVTDRKQGFQPRRYKVNPRGGGREDGGAQVVSHAPSSGDGDFTTVQRRRPLIKKKPLQGDVGVAVA